MAIKTILEETALSFSYDEQNGAFVNKSNPSLFLPVVGEEYHITWDGTEIVCTAFTVEESPNVIYLGNTIALNGVDTGEPFFFASLADGTGAELYTFSAETTHTIAVYQDIAVEEDTGVIIKDRNGADIVYKGINAIRLNKVGGGTQMFAKGEPVENLPIEVDFSNGNQLIEAPSGVLVKSAIILKPENLKAENIINGVNIGGVEGSYITPTGTEKTVDLDFSNGDMSITPNENELFSKVNIPTPETLIPENIAEGINIAGILGTLAASGGAMIVGGTVKGNGTTVTVNHRLGRIPKAIAIFAESYKTTNGYGLTGAFGVSQEVMDAAGIARGGFSISMYYYSSKYYAYFSSFAAGFEGWSATNGAINSVTDESFGLGGTGMFVVTETNKNYYWYAIG